MARPTKMNAAKPVTREYAKHLRPIGKRQANKKERKLGKI